MQRFNPPFFGDPSVSFTLSCPERRWTSTSTQIHLDEWVARPHPRHDTVRLSGTIIRGSNGDPLGGALVAAEEMVSGDTHYGVSDDRGDFSIEGLRIDRMCEVKLGKKGIIPTSITVFLSGDKDVGRISPESPRVWS